METWCGNYIWHLTIQIFTYLKSTLEKVVDITLVSLFKNSRELFLLYCWFEHISHLFLVFLLLGLNRYKFVYNTFFFWLSVASRWNFANIDNWISFFFFFFKQSCYYPFTRYDKVSFSHSIIFVFHLISDCFFLVFLFLSFLGTSDLYCLVIVSFLHFWRYYWVYLKYVHCSFIC